MQWEGYWEMSYLSVGFTFFPSLSHCGNRIPVSNCFGMHGVRSQELNDSDVFPSIMFWDSSPPPAVMMGYPTSPIYAKHTGWEFHGFYCHLQLTAYIPLEGIMLLSMSDLISHRVVSSHLILGFRPPCLGDFQIICICFFKVVIWFNWEVWLLSSFCQIQDGIDCKLHLGFRGTGRTGMHSNCIIGNSTRWVHFHVNTEHSLIFK